MSDVWELVQEKERLRERLDEWEEVFRGYTPQGVLDYINYNASFLSRCQAFEQKLRELGYRHRNLDDAVVAYLANTLGLEDSNLTD